MSTARVVRALARANFFCAGPGDDDVADVLAEMREALVERGWPILPLYSPPDVHVSLSRTFVMQLHGLETYVAALQKALAPHRAVALELGSLAVLTNETGARQFLVADVGVGARAVLGLIDTVDVVNVQFALPTFYEQRRVHATLLSWPSNRASSTTTPPPDETVAAMMARQEAVKALLAVDHTTSHPATANDMDDDDGGDTLAPAAAAAQVIPVAQSAFKQLPRRARIATVVVKAGHKVASFRVFALDIALVGCQRLPCLQEFLIPLQPLQV